MIAGRLWPQLGGEPKLLDIVGLNYYHDNQWLFGGPPIAAGHAHSKPFRYFLTETYARYGRPLLVAETGTEGDVRAAWFSMMVSEVEAARAPACRSRASASIPSSTMSAGTTTATARAGFCPAAW